MIFTKALLAALGLRTLPDQHNEAVHDAKNVKAAVLAGHARIVRLSAAADRAAEAGSHKRQEDLVKKQSEVRDSMRDMLKNTVERTK